MISLPSEVLSLINFFTCIENLLLTCKSLSMKDRECIPYVAIHEKFLYGRCTQLVIDRSEIIPRCKQGRRYEISNTVYDMAKQQIIEEACKIISQGNKKFQLKNRFLLDTSMLKSSDGTSFNRMYIGRCFQFLLDSASKKYRIGMRVLAVEEIQERAHRIKAKCLEKQSIGFK